MDTEGTIRRQNRIRAKRNRTLAGEYLHKWYVLVLTVIMCFPGYAAEVLLYNVMVMNKFPAFLAAFLAILIGGLICTLPFFAFNLYLVLKKKKYYAIVCQIAVMEIIGMVFFLYNQILLNLV